MQTLIPQTIEQVEQAERDLKLAQEKFRRGPSRGSEQDKTEMNSAKEHLENLRRKLAKIDKIERAAIEKMTGQYDRLRAKVDEERTSAFSQALGRMSSELFSDDKKAEAIMPFSIFGRGERFGPIDGLSLSWEQVSPGINTLRQGTHGLPYVARLVEERIAEAEQRLQAIKEFRNKLKRL